MEGKELILNGLKLTDWLIVIVCDINLIYSIYAHVCWYLRVIKIIILTGLNIYTILWTRSGHLL